MNFGPSGQMRFIFLVEGGDTYHNINNTHKGQTSRKKHTLEIFIANTRAPTLWFNENN